MRWYITLTVGVILVGWALWIAFQSPKTYDASPAAAAISQDAAAAPTPPTGAPPKKGGAPAPSADEQ